MSQKEFENIINKEYEFGFKTDIESDVFKGCLKRSLEKYQNEIMNRFYIRISTQSLQTLANDGRATLGRI